MSCLNIYGVNGGSMFINQFCWVGRLNIAVNEEHNYGVQPETVGVCLITCRCPPAMPPGQVESVPHPFVRWGLMGCLKVAHDLQVPGMQFD